MPYPPPVPPATRTNATVMATNHPADHNLISVALTEILNHIATLEGSVYPIGTVTMSVSDVPPGNHLLCQGQPVSKTEYPEVFALIGAKYGAGDASNFIMPDLRGRSPMGYWAGGTWAGSFGIGGNADSSLPAHTHPGPAHQHGMNFMSGDESANHYHFPDSGGMFVMNGSGSGGSAGIGPGTGYSLGMPAGRTNTHQHSVSGATNATDPYTIPSAGISPTNTNIHPVTVINFVMRMH
jgi:microcystin-dependent protein